MGGAETYKDRGEHPSVPRELKSNQEWEDDATVGVFKTWKKPSVVQL